jgi:hypothetical protein
MINPSAQDVEGLFQFKLVGFNNRGYDNHILWGAYMGLNNEQLYNLSQKIINGNGLDGKYNQAYNLSYADVHDYSSKKQTLKKWMIELGLHHMEMDIPWDQPVPPELWAKVVEYCCNDVVGLEGVFDACRQDFLARRILSDLSGLSINDTTRMHATKIMFGADRNPQDKFIYTDLSREFPGYVFDPYKKLDKSTYRGESVGEGGYVYAEPGMYENVALLDVASMHPTSIEQLDLFGPYTEKFSNLKAARLAIKHGNFEEAQGILPGLEYISPENAKALSDALKLVINSIYGYTSATFPNAFRDMRNVDNIVAKRGALFMIDLKHFVQEQGFQVVHIKTDSIKIPNATPEIIEKVSEFGKRYGYEFEHEATYDKFCLVNDAVYIARKDNEWTATGAEFKHPVVFKALFSGEPITFNDLCETKSVKAPYTIYLDFNENEATPNQPYKGMHFIGRVGMFVPVTKSAGGAKLIRVKDDKTYAISGTKGYYWLEAEMVKEMKLKDVEGLLYEDMLNGIQDDGTIFGVIDMTYYEELASNAIESIEKFGSYREFIS